MELKDNNKTNLTAKLDIKEIINLSKKLIEVLEKENRLLQANQMSSYQALVDYKFFLIKKIEDSCLKIKENPQLLAHTETDKKLELKSLQQKLEALKDQNTLYLGASISTNKKISEIIKKILINRVKMKSGYCNKGLYNSAKKQGYKFSAISFNAAT